jgi:hypothetical protein
MVIPFLFCAVLLQGTASPQTAPPATLPPLLLKDTIQDFPRSQLQINLSDPITTDLNQNTRTAYETLAQMAGWNVVFDSEFRDSFPAPLHLEKIGIVDALDRLSVATGNFVDVVNSNTIVVAPNTQTGQRNVETQVLKTIYVPSAKGPEDLTAVLTKLRTLNFRQIAINSDAKAIVIKDTPERIAAAEQSVANAFPIKTSDAVAITSFGTLLIQHGTAIEKKRPDAGPLQISASSPISINSNDNVQATYAALAARAGLNILFDRDFRDSGPVTVKFINTDVLDAFDLLSRQTGNFWEPLNDTTVLVSRDNQTKRREYAQQILETVYFENTSTPAQMTEMITALRTILNMRYLAQVPARNALGMRETPGQIALAEKILTDIGKLKSTAAASGLGTTFAVGSESGGPLKTRAVRNLLPDKFPIPVTSQTISIDVSDGAVSAFQQIASKAGLEVTFDKQFKDLLPQRFALKDVPVLDALDFLAIQTGTFWVPVNGTTIFVTIDNQATRQQVQPRSNEVIPLTTIQTPVGVTEVTVALKTLLNVRQADGSPKGINVADSSDNVALAELLVANLDKQQ